MCKIVEDMSSTLLMESVQLPNLKFEELCQTLGIISIRVSCKVPQTGGTGPGNWGQNKKVRMKTL